MYAAIDVPLSRLRVDDNDGAGFRRRCVAHISNPGMSITPKIKSGSDVSHTAAIHEGSASTETPHNTTSLPCPKARLIDTNMAVRRDVCSSSVPRSLLSVVSNASIAQKCWASQASSARRAVESSTPHHRAPRNAASASARTCWPTALRASRWQHHHRRR